MRTTLFAAACGCLLAASLTAHAADTGIRTLVQGPRSSIDKPEQDVVRTQADWEKLWARHLAKTVSDTPRPAPTVDWTKEMVLAEFLGTRVTGGYRVEITGTQVQNGKLQVSVTEWTPAPGTLRSQSVIYPFHIVAVPKTDMPVEWKMTVTPSKRPS